MDMLDDSSVVVWREPSTAFIQAQAKEGQADLYMLDDCCELQRRRIRGHTATLPMHTSPEHFALGSGE
jgi:hypothetical protein